MAHFARIENNIVTDVIVAEQEHIDTLEGTWVETSKTGSIRSNFAGLGYTYDSDADVFYAPSPFPSWTLNTEDYIWESPSPYPTDGEKYTWDEDTTSWVVFTTE